MVHQLHSDTPQIRHGVFDALPAQGLEHAVISRHFLLTEDKELSLKIATVIQIHVSCVSDLPRFCTCCD